MVNVIEQLAYERMKDWFRTNTYSGFLDGLVIKYGGLGYVLNTENGLLFRNLFTDEELEARGRTTVYIIFARCVDLHRHPKMTEKLGILEGEGALFTHLGGAYEEESPLFPGKTVTVPAGLSHSFRPKINSFLKVRLECDRLYTDEEEVCEVPFDKFLPWFHYYKQFRR